MSDAERETNAVRNDSGTASPDWFPGYVCYNPGMTDVDELLNTTPSDLIEGLKKLRDERSAVESREAVLKQLLDIHLARGGEVAEEVAAFAAQNGFGPLREQIRQVLTAKQEDGTPLLPPMAVHGELGARGNRGVTLDNVRTTMKRMADDGELVRPEGESAIYGLPNIPQELLDVVAGQIKAARKEIEAR